MPVSLLCSSPFFSVQYSLSFNTAGLLPCWERASYSASCVLSEKRFVMFYVFFPPGVIVGTLNLIASIPGLFLLSSTYTRKS